MAKRLRPPPGNDPIRLLVYERMQDLGLETKVLARKIGRGETYVWQYLYAGSPRILPEEIRHKMAGVLGVDPRALAPNAPPAPPTPFPVLLATLRGHIEADPDLAMRVLAECAPRVGHETALMFVAMVVARLCGKTSENAKTIDNSAALDRLEG